MSVTKPPSSTGRAGKSRFRTARELTGLTQQQLADRCELSLKTIKRYDAGGHPRSVELAQRLAEILDQPLEWLWPPEEHLQVRVSRANFPAPALEREGGSTVPDPGEVLATLHQSRPRVPGRRVLFVAVPTLAAAAVAAGILATNDHGHSNAGTTPAAPRANVATPTFTPRPLIAARATETADGDRSPNHREPQHRRAAAKRHRAAKHNRAATPTSTRSVGTAGSASVRSPVSSPSGQASQTVATKRATDGGAAAVGGSDFCSLC